ncbi:uncharacterized protein VTP21DRAFT_6516 [Calcarisporiella thermophila]|uniref:uncharacterized protein n=1 Tax=Calcarisporiella thermophila TaxID=911321 RepID=UPI0037420F1C
MSLLRRLIGDSRWTRLAILLTTVQVLTVILLQTIIFIYHNQQIAHLESIKSINQIAPNFELSLANARSLGVYHILFMVAQIFQLVYTFDAIIRKNTIQIIALAIFDVALLIYSGVQLFQVFTLATSISYETSTWPLLCVIVVMIVCSLAFSFLSYKLYQEFGWNIYKQIGADLAMRDMYKIYQIFQVILKFDFFFFLAFSVQYLVLILPQMQPQMQPQGESVTSSIVSHIILSTLVTLGMMLFAVLGIRRESKVLTIISNLANLGQMAYFIYELVNINTNREKYTGSRIFLTFFLTACLLLAIITFALSITAMLNYDRGLKHHLSRKINDTDSAAVALSDKPKRWSIE